MAGRTFKNTPQRFEGLVKGKKVYVASARGGVHSAGSPKAAMDQQESYLLASLSFLGMSDAQLIRAEGLALGYEAKATALARAKAQILALAA